MASSEIASSGSNNTKVGPCRNTFMLTIQNSLLDKLDSIYKYCSQRAGFTYGIACLHNKGHNEQTLPHVHIVLQYRNPIRLSIKKLCGAHVDTLKFGSIQKMVAYAKGETGHDDIEGFEAEVLWEDGEMRRNGGMKTIGEVKAMSADEIDDLPCILRNVAKQIKEEQQANDLWDSVLDEVWNDKLNGPEVVYITGDAGVGKTYGAIKMAKELGYSKDDVGKVMIENNFFSFNKPNADCLIVPEFRPSQCRASLLLEFLDKYGFNAPVKGGFHFVRPRTIIIASIVPPEDLYIDEEKNKQFLRRISKVIRLEAHE